MSSYWTKQRRVNKTVEAELSELVDVVVVRLLIQFKCIVLVYLFIFKKLCDIVSVCHTHLALGLLWSQTGTYSHVTINIYLLCGLSEQMFDGQCAQ